MLKRLETITLLALQVVMLAGTELGVARGFAQDLEPDAAHVNLYFPQLADGGNQLQRWETSITLSNPSNVFVASCEINFAGDSGLPLALDFGGGASSRLMVSLPPQGTSVYRTASQTVNTVTGWAFGGCNSPVQGVV